MSPEFIFFDLGNVLVSFDRERAAAQVAEVTGVPRDEVARFLHDVRLHDALERGHVDWSFVHAEFSRRTGTRSDAAAVARAACDMFTPNVDMQPLLDAIARAGIRMGILSNTCAIHWDHLAASDHAILRGPFDTVVLSYEVGRRKPEPAIYETAARLAGASPERIFFTDDIPAHVEAARLAGWDAEVFSTASALRDALWHRGVVMGR
jgi:FMN phosphatase YigB (HAD superfamily)